MKKRLLLTLLLAALLCALFAGQALAAQPYVTDEIGYLNADEQAELERLAREISEKNQCGVYIAVIEDYTRWARNIEDCAQILYKEWDLGWGSDKSGLLLIMSMRQREYDLAAFGYGNTAFTDYGKEVLSGYFLDDFRQDDWYRGYLDYLYQASDMIASARSGSPVDVPQRDDSGPNFLNRLLFTLMPGCMAGFIVTASAKAKMKNAVQRSSAEEYVVPGSVNLFVQNDLFLHRSRSVQVIHESHGSGGTHVNSSGFSHHSGKF